MGAVPSINAFCYFYSKHWKIEQTLKSIIM